MTVFTSYPTKFSTFLEQELSELGPIYKERKGVLKSYCLNLIADKYPSMTRIVNQDENISNVKKITQALKDLNHCDPVFRKQRMELFKSLDRRKSIYLGGDDTTVSKCGKEVFSVHPVYDHAKHLHSSGWVIIDVSIKHGGVVYGALYHLKAPRVPKKNSNPRNPYHLDMKRK